MLLSQVSANLCHNQEVTNPHRFTGRRPRNAPRWTPYVAPLRGTMLSPKKWWHWKLPKPMPPKPYEGRSDLILGGLLTTAPALLVVNHKHYLFRLSWYLARRCPAMTPDTQTSTSQYVSVITDHLSCVARWKPPTTLAIRTLTSISVVSKFPAPNCLFCTFAFASMIITKILEICKIGGRNESKVLICTHNAGFI